MMDVRDRNGLIQAADEAIAKSAYNPGKLMLIHTAVALGASLLVTLLSFLLTRQIDTTGGLAGMGTRSVLETVQSLLDFGVMVALPMWEIGAVYAAMRIFRGRAGGVETLAEGFRQFWPVLRLLLLEGLIYLGIAMACSYGGMMLYLLTPLSLPLMETVEPLVADITTTAQLEALMADEVFINTVMSCAVSMFVVVGALYCAVLIPMSYRLRMIRYLILDEPGMGAMAAIKLSGRMTRGCKLELFKLDLRFWWFYLLQGLIVALGFGTELLSLAGISLSVSADTAFWLFYVAYALGQLGLYTFARAKVEVTFAAAYEALRLDS